MRSFSPSRLLFVLLIAGIILVARPVRLSAQDDGETPLGDVARKFRKQPAPSETVVDNDNLSKVVDDAAARRAAGATPVFALEAAEKSMHLSSPDVMCSLSFSAKTNSQTDSLMLGELPRDELSKLDGPATIDGDSLQISIHNGSLWDLREVVIGLTIVKRNERETQSFGFGQARITPAVAGVSAAQMEDSNQKQPDVTLLLHVKGSAAPSATAMFRTPLNFALFPDQDWHWAIVRAKGIPPQASLEAVQAQIERGLEDSSHGGAAPIITPAVIPPAAIQPTPAPRILAPPAVAP